MSKSPTIGHTLDAAGWLALRQEVLGLFTPGSPVDEHDLFSGRQDQIQKMVDTLVSKGRHAVVFGERGVGKTSLANIFFYSLLEGRKKIHHVYVQCVKEDTFDSIWRKAFRRIKFTFQDKKAMFADEMLDGTVTADEIEILLSNFTQNEVPIIVFDEFDRIADKSECRKMSETIKQLSNANSNCTIVIVGVGDSVIELIEEHQSVSRALVQVQMPRMHIDELKDIVASRLRRTVLKISDDALWRIAFLSSGLPFYAHALGQSSALAAVEAKSFTITEQMVNASIAECFKDLDQSLIDGYVKATVKTRKGNIFREVLAACSLADQDDLGRFSAASVEAPLSEIMKREMKSPAFAFHLNKLCTLERGNILQKAGERAHFRFRFVQPIIQPYIALKSLSDQIMTAATLERFATQRQRRLSI